MLLDKVRRGVIEVASENGSRFYTPNFSERLRLLWAFRNFNVLPEGVLNEHERQIIEQLCEQATKEQKLAAKLRADRERDCVIGIVERELQLATKKPSGSVPASGQPSRASHP